MSTRTYQVSIFRDAYSSFSRCTFSKYPYPALPTGIRHPVVAVVVVVVVVVVLVVGGVVLIQRQ